MVNPAFQRSGSGEDQLAGNRKQHEAPSSGAFAAHATADLIKLRDRLLEECLDLESRISDESGKSEQLPKDPSIVRAKIDEIHQELAFRDLAERAGAARVQRGANADLIDEFTPGKNTGLPASALQKSAQILKAIEMRSRFMDELAQAAREQGQLDQAAAFTLNAQKLDLERVDVLRQLSALSGRMPDADE